MTTTTTIADVASKIAGVTNRGAWTSTPTSSGKVTIPAGYHSGSGYVDTSKVYNAGMVANAGNLKLSQSTYNTDWLTVTVPSDVTKGTIVSICSAGTHFTSYQEVSGNGLTINKTLFENRYRLNNGVTTSVRVLNCTFTPGNTIKSGWNDTAYDLSIHFILIFA